ncbi:MAG: AtpZ/AtpI family protein [bacterium]|nr:AtpZ/AtpI family protein [bacterium]MCM1375294.1 AtpZ/AtpI family protein [Muribaculum sp.]MCM1409789.1 AtpZ/AtpI family protein [Lachnospiraceae bacterium]
MSKKAPYDRKGKQDKSAYRALVMLMQFGINMLVPIGIMSWLGILLDRRCDTSFFMILFFFVGAIAGFQNIWRMAKSIYEDKPPGEKPSAQARQENGQGKPDCGESCSGGWKESDDK